MLIEHANEYASEGNYGVASGIIDKSSRELVLIVRNTAVTGVSFEHAEMKALHALGAYLLAAGKKPHPNEFAGFEMVTTLLCVLQQL